MLQYESEQSLYTYMHMYLGMQQTLERLFEKRERRQELMRRLYKDE